MMSLIFFITSSYKIIPFHHELAELFAAFCRNLLENFAEFGKLFLYAAEVGSVEDQHFTVTKRP